MLLLSAIVQQAFLPMREMELALLLSRTEQRAHQHATPVLSMLLHLWGAAQPMEALVLKLGVALQHAIAQQAFLPMREMELALLL
jgi:ureidoglycolate hydrolase